MMDDILDISLPVTAELPRWPGDPPFLLERFLSLDRGDSANASRISCSVHVGTHVDAPVHFLEDAPAVDRMPLELLIGPAWVADAGDASAIGPSELERMRIPAGTRRLLLRTKNSKWWTEPRHEFHRDFAALTPDGAQWIVTRGIGLIGIDYLSVQRFQDPDPETHRILLRARTIIVEGLDLREAAPGGYRLCCLPMKIVGADGAPARAILLRGEGGTP